MKVPPAQRWRSAQCQLPDNEVHVGCGGLARFDLNDGVGCLCPCHDLDDPPPGHPDHPEHPDNVTPNPPKENP